MATVSTIRTTSSVVSALITALEALTYTTADGAVDALFGKVGRFDAIDLEKAMLALVTNTRRVAVVVYLGERYQDITDSRRFGVGRTINIGVLMADQVIGDRSAAVFGSDNNPGAIGIKDLAMPVLTGLLLPNPGGVVLDPTGAELVYVEDKDRKLAGRSAIVVEIEARGGTYIAELSAGPNR